MVNNSDQNVICSDSDIEFVTFVLSEAQVAHLCSDLERKVNRFNSIGCFVKASTLYSDLSSTMLHSLTHCMTQLLHIDWSSQYSWWRGTVVERRSLAGELSLSCARPAADG